MHFSCCLAEVSSVLIQFHCKDRLSTKLIQLIYKAVLQKERKKERK